MVDVLAHALHGLCCLLQAQHREHATHLQQLAGHRAQQALFRGPAEELVQRFLELGQMRAQLVDHGAHGLAIAHAAVELLHPGFERLRLAAFARAFDAAGELDCARGELPVLGIEVLEGRLQVQHRGRDFHCEFGRRRVAGAHRRVDRVVERLHHGRAGRVQPAERFAELGEGVGHLPHARDVAARQRRPHFLGGLDALARLRQHDGIEAAELRRRIVHVLEVGDAPGHAHGAQQRRLLARGGHGLCAEEEQVLPQPVGHRGIATCERGVLQQHARRGAFHIHVGWQQRQRQRLEEAGRQHPETGHLGLWHTEPQAHAQRTQAARRLVIAALDHLEHVAVQVRPHGGVVDHGAVGTRARHLGPHPRIDPQVCGMHPLVAHQLQHVAVLREQRDRRHRLARQHGLQEIGDREAGLLDLLHRGLGAARGLVDEALRCEFHRAEHHGRRWVAHQAQGPHGLVQLLARHAQQARVQLGHLAVLAGMATQGLARAFERFLDLADDPGQRPEVFRGGRVARDRGGDRGADRHVGLGGRS
ncbi:Uncharacterised protein [Xylophilus ampelinus]|nr:Uncharacterised protein [Xylophilus ampelinus]